MGVHGKKYLVLSKGDKRAMPKPPFVKASRMPWLADNKKKKTKQRNHCLENIPSSRKRIQTKIPIHKAKKSEWKNPLWPRKCWYGMPKENPMISASGIIEQTIAEDQKWLGRSRGANAIPAAAATTAWDMTEGTISFLYMSSLCFSKIFSHYSPKNFFDLRW